MYQASYQPNWGLVAECSVRYVAVKVAAQFKSHYREVNGTVEFTADGPMVGVGKLL
jgi:hypothetical protein